MEGLQPGQELTWECVQMKAMLTPRLTESTSKTSAQTQHPLRNRDLGLFELTGIPTEELGLPAGDFDFTISDTVTDMYDGEVELFFMGGAMELLDEPTQMITIDDGSTIEVHQAYASPTPLAFPAMWAMMWANSVVGSGDYPGIVDALLRTKTSKRFSAIWLMSIRG